MTQIGTRKVDLTFQTFGNLLVLGPGKPSYWLCRCECGTEREFRGARLTTGYTKSCGCIRTSIRKKDYTGTPEWVSYHAAKTRCTNPKQTHWEFYGGRGIEFRFTSFEQFFSEIGKKPTPEHTLDRINVDGHYAPGNVRWATPSEQRINSRNPKRGFQKKAPKREEPLFDSAAAI